MTNCQFCKIDKSLFYNKKLEETNNFIIIPCLGSLVPGYILILLKKYTYCMTNFNENIMKEYKSILEKYREKLKKIYGKYPIIFEHGTKDPCGVCTSCVIHAHTHIVNHNYHNEQEVIKNLNFSKINNLEEIENKIIFTIKILKELII